MYRQALLAAVLLTGATEPRPSTGRIEGTVRDSAGAPVANAQVIVVSRPWTTMSDSAGHYRLADIPAGRYIIQRLRRSDTGVRRWPTWRVTAGAATRLDLTLTRSPVEQQLPRDEAGARGRSRQARRGRLEDDVPGSAGGPPERQWAVVPRHRADEHRELRRHRGVALPAGRQPTRAPPSRSTSTPRATPTCGASSPAGQRPPRDAVRIEELLNYFRYDYPEPDGKRPLQRHDRRRRGARGRRSTGCCASASRARSLRTEAVPPSNLVFLIDVSGSMQPPNKLPLVKQAFRLLVQELRPAGPRGHRGVRRRGRPGAALHARRRTRRRSSPRSTGSRPAAPPPAAPGSGSPTRSRGSTTTARATTG